MKENQTITNIQEAIEKALEYKKKNDWDSVSSIYQQLIEIQPDNATFYDELAQSQSQRELFAEAINNYQKALDLDIENPLETYKNLGDALVKENRINESISVYQEFFKLKSLGTNNFSSIEKQNEFSDNGSLENGDGIDKSFTEEDLDPNKFEFYLKSGEQAEKEGNLNEASKFFRKALKIDSSHAEVNHRMGEVLSRQELYKEAVSFYSQAIKTQPKHPWAYRGLGYALQNQGDVDKAIGCYKKAIEQRPDYVYAHQYLGDALKEKNLISEAINSYRKAITINPKLFVLYRSLGECLIGQGEFDEGIKKLNNALEVNKDPQQKPQIYMYLGEAFERKGDLEKAEKYYFQAIENNISNPYFYIQIARLKKNQNNWDESITFYRKAISIKSDLPLNIYKELGNLYVQLSEEV